MQYRADIDGLRAVAIAPVVLYHAGGLAPGGYVGVDVFFVISGFLIGSIVYEEVRERRFSLLQFYERRVRRILPALVAVIAATLMVSTAVMTPLHLQSVGDSAFAAAIFIANLHFYFGVDYFSEVEKTKPLLNLWSLAVEEQFYVVFPIALLVIAHLRRPWLTLLACSAIAAMSFDWAVRAVAENPAAAFYLPQARVWELLVGVILAIAATEGWAQRCLPARWVGELAAVLGLALIAYSIIVYDAATPFPGWAAVPPCLGAALIVLAGLGPKTLIAHMLSRAPMVALGKISYSLYLWHWPMLVFLDYLSPAPPSLAAQLLVAAASVFVAWISWCWIETPLRRWPARPAHVFQAGGIATIAVFVPALTLFFSAGLPDRFSSQQQATLASLSRHRVTDCHPVTVTRAQNGDICVIGAKGVEPSFMLVGDSHAGALSPAMAAAARSLGLSGLSYTGSAFRPLIGVERQGRPDFAREVGAFVAYARSRPEISDFYLAGYWSLLFTGSSYRRVGDVWIDDAHGSSGAGDNARAAINGLIRLAEALPGRRFVIFDDGPSSAQLEPERAIRFARLYGDTGPFGAHPDTLSNQRRSYEPLFLQLAKIHPGFVYFRVHDALCGPSLCPAFDEDAPRYRDGDHLTPSGAAHVTPALVAALQMMTSDRSNPPRTPEPLLGTGAVFRSGAGD